MVDVVEAVARALCRNDGYDPDQHWEEFVRAARAAIAAYEAERGETAREAAGVLLRRGLLQARQYINADEVNP